VTLQAKLVYTKWVLWLGVVVSAVVFAAIVKTSAFYFFPIPVLVTLYVPRRLNVRYIRAAYKQVARLSEAGSFDASRRLIFELRGLYVGSRSATEGLRLMEGSLLSLEGRYAEAAALLASIDPAQLAPGHRPVLLSHLSWSLALSGSPAAAVLRARESFAASDAAGDRPISAQDLRASQLCSLGTALVLAGDVHEGVPLLEQAMARGGSPRQQGARAFFLAEGLRGLGRHTDAATAYHRAIQEGPSSEFGKRAEAALAGMSAYRS
jgi:tetratricopeptide (TPR) repeat protein